MVAPDRLRPDQISTVPADCAVDPGYGKLRGAGYPAAMSAESHEAHIAGAREAFDYAYLFMPPARRGPSRMD